MTAYGEDGRFERAGEVRSRLHTVARTLSAVRRREALGAVDEVVLARTGGPDTEIVVVRRGRLAGSARRQGRLDDGEVAAVAAELELDELPGPPQRDDAEEVGLVLDWLDRAGVRLVVASGWSEPAAGGSALAQVVDEARRVARQLRRDRQVLAGTKIVRRAPVDA
jgi:DNA polymerase III subunit epsilon